MNFVIPMAGRGQRFKDAGFDMPKMLLQAHGKSLLEWSVDSLPLELATKIIFIGLKEHEANYNLSNFIKSKYSKYNLEFIFLDETTRGQAETVYIAKDIIDARTDLVVFNIDTYFCSKSLKYNLLRNDIDGVLGSFSSNESRFSFAKTDKNGYVLETAEKIIISNNALTGMYHFKHPNDFFEVAQKYIENNILDKGEFYIAPMYNELISNGKKLIVDSSSEHWILGTPDEYDNFLNHYLT